MKKPLPPITWFRAFDATARHLSFTLAAQELGFTQSAISQNVRALEEKLGTPLFIRGHRALSLTQAGRLLVPDVAAAMAQLEQATERFLPSTGRPKLTVAVSVSVAQWLLAPQLFEFIAQHPEIALQIVTTIWPDDFAATSADVEIRFGRKEVVGTGADLLLPSCLQAVAAPQVAKSLTQHCDWKTLASSVLIQPVGITSGWQTLAKNAGGPADIEASLFTDTHGLAVDFAVTGTGIALTHSLITRNALADGRLVTLALPEMDAEEGYYLAVKPSTQTEAQESFLTWFHTLLQ